MAAKSNKSADKVEVRLRKINEPNAPQEEFYSVNFKNVIIKRGVPVVIGKEFKEAIDNSDLAQDEAITYAEANGLREPGNNI